MGSFEMYIDYRDINKHELLKLINEQALMQDCDQIKEAYMHDYLIQIDLSSTNGMALKREDTQPKKTIANVFLKFAYTDTDGLMLTSAHNKLIIDDLISKLDGYIAKCSHTDASLTFTPYFDITIKDT